MAHADEEVRSDARVRLVRFQAGVHGYVKPEPNLPRGIGPAVAQLWHQAITQGYYV